VLYSKDDQFIVNFAIYITSLLDGSPFTECETLHTTLLRIKIRDNNGIARNESLPSLIPSYCSYKTDETNWICEESLCKSPLKPKFMIQGPPVFPKACP
jgi:hypothetical protein